MEGIDTKRNHFQLKFNFVCRDSGFDTESEIVLSIFSFQKITIVSPLIIKILPITPIGFVASSQL